MDVRVGLSVEDAVPAGIASRPDFGSDSLEGFALPPRQRPFALDGFLDGRMPRALARLAAGLSERALALSRLDETYRRLPACASPGEFARQSLDALGLQFRIDMEEVSRIPRTGPVVLLANHPLGGAEGLFLIWQLACLRDDFRLLGNSLLHRIPELRSCLIPLDILGGRTARPRNAVALRAALRHLRAQGALAVFPAGEVSSFQPRAGAVVDPAWSSAAVRMARLARATVIPVFFGGRGGLGFQAAGLLHPSLRTMLLPRQLVSRRRDVVAVSVGRPWACDPLMRSDDDHDTRRLRVATYALGLEQSPADARPAPSMYEPVIEPVDAAAMADEVASLPNTSLLASHAGLAVHLATAAQVPAVLREIGRLRETTFRAVGEGSGRAVDLDRYDLHYQHLFVWDGRAREVVGAYRVGKTDRIVARHGLEGLYTHSLFEFGHGFLQRMGPSLELGRSFVRPERQRSFAPLMLLWKGIGRLVSRDPRHATLFGPASLSADYGRACLELMVEYLRMRHGDRKLARLVEGRNPLRSNMSRALRHEMKGLLDLDDLEAVLRTLCPDCTGIPVLVRQYLKLGAAVAGFNVDPAFGHCVDCLVVTDLRRAEDRALCRYLGEGDTSAFRAFHALERREITVA